MPNKPLVIFLGVCLLLLQAQTADGQLGEEILGALGLFLLFAATIGTFIGMTVYSVTTKKPFTGGISTTGPESNRIAGRRVLDVDGTTLWYQGVRLDVCDAPDCVLMETLAREKAVLRIMGFDFQTGVGEWVWNGTDKGGLVTGLHKSIFTNEGTLNLTMAADGTFDGVGPRDGEIFYATWSTDLSDEEIQLAEGSWEGPDDMC